MSNTRKRSMYFKVSTGLKNLIGQELITNAFVAIFELVKNSFDAGAKNVQLIFETDSISIVDDGKGMSLADIKNKWLFVAYSAKKDGTEDKNGNYREKINEHKRYAGSKGVGRFSCDRLGASLALESKVSGQGGIERIDVLWSDFERTAKDEFTSIAVEQRTLPRFTHLPREGQPDSGTHLRITQLRETWDRAKLLELKRALAKLINPFDSKDEDFRIIISASEERSQDLAECNGVDPSISDLEESDLYWKVVNGQVHNFIFSTLSAKTTNLRVQITADGQHIRSTLTDRGSLIYEIEEMNPYTTLSASEFDCHLFYLNMSAKSIFARRMGVPSIKFGSVMLFRNGFRVFPVGESGDDTWGLDSRKQQGHARFIGTRDVIGRIDVEGSEVNFKESTSRDQGLIETPAYRELVRCFIEKCIRRLERYVVDISWKDPADKDAEDISRMLTDRSSTRISELVAKLAGTDGVRLLSYNPDIVRIVDEKAEGFENNLGALRTVAERTANKDLLVQIESAQRRYSALKLAEARAREQAEEERRAREAAESAASRARSEQSKAEKQYLEERKRNLFLSALNGQQSESLVNLHHQIVIYAADAQNVIANGLDYLKLGELTPDRAASVLEHLAFRTQQILAVSRFATRANFRLDSDEIKEDLIDFIDQYVEQICPLYAGNRLIINVKRPTEPFVLSFKPIEISMLIENLISNADKFHASRVNITISRARPNEIIVEVDDDGDGLDSSISEPERIFEKGYSTTTGSGLGLHHSKFIVEQLGGSIHVDASKDVGTRFIIRIFK